MKKMLIIPAIIATAFSTADAYFNLSNFKGQPDAAVSQEKAEQVYVIGQKEIKLSDKHSVNFSKLVGYKTIADVHGRVNGQEIGLICNTFLGTTSPLRFVGAYLEKRKFYFVRDEFAAKDWFVEDADICGDIMFSFVGKISGDKSLSFAVIETGAIDKVVDGVFKFSEAAKLISTYTTEKVDEKKPEIKKDEVFFVGQKTLEISENGKFEFANLMGYKTREDAKKKENGILIGFEVSTLITEDESTSKTSTRFVKPEFADESWWINQECGWVERITSSQLKSVCVCQNNRTIDELTAFSDMFDHLSAKDKAEYISDLKMYVTAMLDDCNSSEYKDFNFALEVLKYLSDKKEYSNADKVALCLIVNKMREKAYFDDADERHDKKEAKYYAYFQPTRYIDTAAHWMQYNAILE